VTAVQMPPVNHDEMVAVDLADEYADEALAKLRSAGDNLATAMVGVGLALLALSAQVSAVRETLNRELPDIGESILDVARNVPSD
jgi:uncharacterized protein YaiI (UPF0178 family)